MALSETDRVFEELLVTEVRAGDRKAAALLAARWQPRLLRTARRLLGDDEQAREAVQDAWLGITRGWGGLRNPARFPAWAYGILHRKCIDRIRRAQRRRAVSAPIEDAPEPCAAPGAEDRMAAEQALSRLGPDHRVAAILYFAEGLTLAEIAEATRVPLGTAKSRIFHARRRLKAALTDNDDQGEDR